MKLDIITLFPEIFDFYLNNSIIKKAKDKGLIKIKTHNLRDFTSDKHKTADDKPFGGGRGMVLKIEPIHKAVNSILSKKKKAKVILFTPRGKKFNQKTATKLSKVDQIVLICGRYEGIDERVDKIVDEKISIGDYVLMGGELPALIFIETVARLIPNVIGNSELLKQRITKNHGFEEYPQYTRPEIFSPKKGVKLRVPKILLSGNHKEIEKWRKKHTKIISWAY